MSRAPATEAFFAATARGLVDTQLALDEAGRDSLDGWDETGVPPTVFTVSRVRLSCPVRLGVPGPRGATTLAAHGPATLTLGFRYLLSPQGGDDPRPAL